MALTPPVGSPGYYQSRATPVPKKKAVVKKPKPKPPGSPDPYNAVPAIAGLTLKQIQGMTPQQVLLYGASVQSAGPNYSAVPKPNWEQMQKSAWQQAGTMVNDQVKPYEAERTRLKANTQMSQQAATNFAKAFASIAGGGNANIDDPAAQKYALENYGGSYVGGMAASLGAQLMGQQQSFFNETDAKYAAQIMQIMDTRPELAEKIYSEVADDAAKQIKEGRSLADMAFKNKLGAIAALGKAMGGSEGMKVRTQSLPGGGVLGYDPQTGKVIYEIPGKGGSSKSGGSSSGGKSGSSKVYGNSETGYYQIVGGKMVPIPGYSPKGSSGSSGNGGPSSPNFSSAQYGRAVKAGKETLQAGANNFIKGAVAYGDKRGWNDDKIGQFIAAKANGYFRTWMTEVIKSIGPHLRDMGYSAAQVKAEAYKIVTSPFELSSGEIMSVKPPKGYKVPTAKNVSFSSTYKGGGGMPLVQLLQQAGFSGEGLRIAYGIALRESGGRPEAFNGNTGTGDRSFGLFQVNTLGSLKSRVKQYGLKSERDLLDPLVNARVAFRMSSGGRDFGAWGIGPNAYRSGAGMDTIAAGYNSFPGYV